MLAFAVLAACEPEEELDVCARASLVDAPGVTLGLGEDAFEERIADGMRVTPVYGSQGGQMLYLAVRTAGFDPGERHTFGQDERIPTFTVALSSIATGEVLTTQEFSFESMDGDETAAELPLGLFYLPYFADGALDDGLLLRTTAEDACGTVLVDEVTFDLDA